jgi:glycosyltransferase involved in cell wall biosynthesis
MAKKIVITSHVVYVGDKDVFGPGHAISTYLEKHSLKYTYIRHSLYDVRYTEIIKYSVKEKKTSLLKLPKITFPLFRYPLEMWYTFRLYRKLKPDICIAIDPVNAFSALLAKKAGFIKTIIFYTADYADKRFENPILNGIYHLLDKFALRNADAIWNVSSRILARRKEQGVPNSKNILIPNTPILNIFKKYHKKVRLSNSLVLMANFTPAIEYDTIMNVIVELKRKIKNIHIGFIGTGELEEKVRILTDKLNLTNNITFHGFMEHDDALKTAAQYEAGLAPYGNVQAWTEYGDSLKAREYMALGLPVIISNNVSTSDDIEKYKAGFSINMKKKELLNSIRTLFTDRGVYEIMQKNAMKLAKDYDLEEILDQELKEKYIL